MRRFSRSSIFQITGSDDGRGRWVLGVGVEPNSRSEGLGVGNSKVENISMMAMNRGEIHHAGDRHDVGDSDTMIARLARLFLSFHSQTPLRSIRTRVSCFALLPFGRPAFRAPRFA